MSYDFIVYTRSNRIPEPSRLATESSSRAPWLVLPASFDLREARGYVDCRPRALAERPEPTQSVRRGALRAAL